jgi:hypothetical protein
MIQTIFGSPVVFLHTNNVEEVFSTKSCDTLINNLLQPSNIVTQSYCRGGTIYAMVLSPNEELTELLDFLKKTALDYVHLYSDTPVKDLKFYGAWCLLTHQGCEIKNHNEVGGPKKSVVVTFYPRVPVGGAELTFIHNGKYHDWVSECSENDLVRVSVNDGTIVIFDNFTLHAVSPHNVTTPRMCITAEFEIETR